MVIFIILLTVCSLFSIIGFYFKGKMDWSGADKFIGIYSHKNRSKSWENKYKIPLEDYKPKWYYLAFDFNLFGKRFKFDGLEKPLYKERYMWSSTVFVFLTDYWHRTQFLFLNSMTVSIAILGGYIGYLKGQNYIYYSLCFGLGYEIYYWIGFKTGFKK